MSEPSTCFQPSIIRPDVCSVSIKSTLKLTNTKAALEFLKTLVLKGKVIVGDAIFCQRDLCQQGIDSGGDYFVVVKENQPQLKRDIELAFANPEVFSPLPTAPRQQQLADRQLAQ